MARAQSQFLRLYDGSASYFRWQNYYINQAVGWSGALWSYQAFAADGFTAGQTGDESSIAVTLPATTMVVDAVQASLAAGWMAELLLYEFDLFDGLVAPPTGQVLVDSFVGEVVGAGGSFLELTLQLGSSLAPVGAQLPPRKFSTRLIGVPLQL
jgi:hypothetical protein